MAARAASSLSDVMALARLDECGSVRPVIWKPLVQLLSGPTSDDWTQRHKEALRSLVSQQQWCQAKQARNGKADTDVCQLFRKCPGTVWHRRIHCEHWRDLRA
eukprot:5885996-Pyramimonas_sp.AAC.1